MASGWDPHRAADRHGSNALLWAAGEGHLEVCKYLADACKVPAVALGPKRRGDERMVRVLDDKGQPQPRKVKVGINNGASAEILSGLQEGERARPRVRVADVARGVRDGVGEPQEILVSSAEFRKHCQLYVQTSDSTQPRTSPPKFARSLHAVPEVEHALGDEDHAGGAPAQNVKRPASFIAASLIGQT